jgi:hypothetical protein
VPGIEYASCEQVHDAHGDKYHCHTTTEKEVETEVQSMFHLSSLLYSAIPRMKEYSTWQL